MQKMPRINPFSKLWLVFSLQIITCFGLPVWSTNTLETGLFSPCTPIKLVVVDDDAGKDNELIIPYSICQVEMPTCFISNQFICDSPIQEAETIQEAQFVDKNGKVNHVPHDKWNFNVSLKGEDFTTQSIYNYTVSYYYGTICNDDGRRTSCSGWINMSLMILVTDVRLTVVSDAEVLTLESDSEAAMTQKRFQVEDASIVDLECSLGLTDLEHLNVQLEFVFTPVDSNATKMVPCNSESIQRVDNWVVTPNMNNNTCHLKIVNISKADGGQYDCLMVLSNSHTSYNQDRSNAIILAVENPKNQDRKSLYYIIPAVIIILCSAIFVFIFVVMKIRKKHHPRPAPGPPAHESDYGSTGSTMSYYVVQCHRATSGEIVNPGQDTPYPTETENETSFSEHDTDSKPTTTSDSPIARPASSSDEKNQKLNASHKQPPSTKRPKRRRSLRPRPSHKNTTSDSSGPGNSGSSSGPGATSESSPGPLSSSLEQNSQNTQEGTHASTISAGTEGRQYYEQYTDIQHADGRQTPENSDAPPNENYKCHHCGKIYHDDQRLFYARHMKECQQRCPNYNGEAAAMNTTNKDTNGAQLPDNLTIEPCEGAARSRGSTMSEIREGKGYYNDIIEVEVPEDGPTPEETEVPLDNHFSCPLCGKTYHENQRLYFKRHMDELRIRCPKYESLMAAKNRPPSSKSSSDLDSY